MKRCSGSHTTREPSTASTVVSFWYMASGLAAPWRRFFTTTRARWSLVMPDVRQSRCARRPKKAGVEARPASSCQGSKKEERMMPLGHLLGAEDEHRVVLPGPDGRRRQHQRGAAAGAAGLDVEDGHARHAEAAEHLVARGHPAVGGAAEGRLEVALADARLAQRRPHGDDAHVGGGDAVEAAEGMQADTGHGDVGHAGAKA